MKKPIPRLHVITDESLQTRHSHVELAQFAVEGGADAIQFREKRLKTTRELIETAIAVAGVCEASNACFIVNDRVDVAASLKPCAVHLGRDDLPVNLARSILGLEVLVGGTANSLQEALKVQQSEVDYLGVGPVFGTTSKAKPSPDLGLENLERICDAVSLPVIAIGNIHPENVRDVLAAGASGIAVLSGVVCQEDVTGSTRSYVEALDSASSS